MATLLRAVVRNGDDRIDVVVHYMHGLESGPHGSKAQFLRENFRSVQAPDQHMSALDPRKRNSPMRSLVPFIVAAMAAVALLPSPWLKLAAAVGAIAGLPSFLRYVRICGSLSRACGALE
jgi:hypothetical protein